MHALSARPLKVQGGRDSSTCADGAIKITLILLCSHPDTHPNFNREVRHSPTWHSSESESALERFEPVAAAMLWSDGRGTLFAPVAARRQKVFKRGIDTYAKHVCRRRRDGSQFFPLFVLFVLFGQAKRTLKEKNHKATFLLSYFSVMKSTKSQQGGLTPSSFRTTVRRARVSRASRAWQVCAARWQSESRWFCRSPQSPLYHACEHITRGSRADSCTHCPTHIQIRATPSPVFSFFRILRLNRSCDLYDGNAGRSGNCTCCRICRKCCRRHCYLIR